MIETFLPHMVLSPVAGSFDPSGFHEANELLNAEEPLNDFDVQNLSFDDLVQQNTVALQESGRYQLLPEHTYSENGYEYTTDDMGRVSHVSGELRLQDVPRNEVAQKLAGGESRLASDDGGHLVANEFGGSGELYNLVPMDSEVNRWGDFRKFEQEMKEQIQAGHEVYVDHHPVYEGDSLRPNSIEINYRIDDEPFKQIISNPAGSNAA